MYASDNVKVWSVDGAPKTESRPVPSRGSPAGNHAEARRRPEDAWERSARNTKLGVWARLAVVVLLGGAMLVWPYARNCGLGLWFYLAAATMIVVGGIWVVACTWTCRMARTHLAAILLTLWGVGLIGVEVLPRVGYAMRPAAWSCAGLGK